MNAVAAAKSRTGVAIDSGAGTMLGRWLRTFSRSCLMYRKLVPLAVAIVLASGCGKKPKDDESGGGGAGGDNKVDSDPNASYTLKLRTAQQGDKVEVTLSDSMTEDSNEGGKPK